MKEILTKKIQNLPPLPESVQKIEAVYHNPMATFEDINVIVEKDPILTATLLKAANSPLYGFSQEIKTVQQAVSLFGMGTVRGFALATLTKQSFKIDLSAYGISPDTFSDLSDMQHALLIKWVGKSHRSKMPLLSPATFMIELGKILIAQCVKESNKSKEFKSALDPAHAESAEKQICESQTVTVTANILKHWNLDPDMIKLIYFSQNPSKAPDEIKELSAIIKSVRMAVDINANITDETVQAAKENVKKFNLDFEKFDEAISKLR